VHVGNEARLMRERVGVIDLTPFTKHEVTGPGAEAWLDGLVANKVPTRIGRLALSHALTRRGGIRSEFTITKLADEHFYVVSAGAAERYDGDFLAKALPADGSVQLRNITNARGCFVLAGPKSRAVLASLTDTPLDNDAFPWLTAQLRCWSNISARGSTSCTTASPAAVSISFGSHQPVLELRRPCRHHVSQPLARWRPIASSVRASRLCPIPFCPRGQSPEGEGRPTPFVVHCPIQEACCRRPSLASAPDCSSREATDHSVVFRVSMTARLSDHHVVHPRRRYHHLLLLRSMHMTGKLPPTRQPRMALWSSL